MTALTPEKEQVTQKYFYHDALAAAYMLKHYGMKFGVRYNADIVWQPMFYDEGWNPIKDVEDILESSATKFYIHPDSLHILEPQVGDMVMYLTNIKENMVKTDWVFWHIKESPGEFQSYLAPDRKYIKRIIQRENKPFFWPQKDIGNICGQVIYCRDVRVV